MVTRFIPNVMKNITATWQSSIENDKTIYKMSTTDLTDISTIKYKFYVSDDTNDDTNDDTKTEIIEVIGNSDNTFTFDKQWANVFCYGKEVDDFHSLDKNKIFVLHHSAIQEIDRQQISDKQRITTLENENTNLKNTVSTLQTELASIKEILQRNNIS